MSNKHGILLITGIAVLGLVAVIWWQGYEPTRNLQASLPGMDNRIRSGDSIMEVIKIGEIFRRLDSAESTLKETWPRFRGSEYDNMSRSAIPLIDKFPESGPLRMWSVDLGEGHSGAAIYKGKAYVLDYDEPTRSDLLRCFNLTDGRELWQRGYRVNIKRNHGMSRTVPAVTDRYILTLGPRAHVMCLLRESGDFLWGMDIEKTYETEIPFWYTGQCPLIWEKQAIIATGGTALMIAIDCETGQVLWETPNQSGWKMSHASVIPWSFGGRHMFVYSAVGGVCGIAADGPDAGQVLWATSSWDHTVVAPSPVCMPDGRIFLSAGYGAGSMVVRVSGSDNSFTVEVLDEYKPVDGLASEQQTPLFWQNHLIGILPKDAGALRNQLVCYRPEKPRDPVWNSGKELRFGLGPYMIADEKLFILSDDGLLTIAKPSVTEYIQLDQYQVLDGHDAWAPIAVADGYMILRDSKQMVCLNMRKSDYN